MTPWLPKRADLTATDPHERPFPNHTSDPTTYADAPCRDALEAALLGPPGQVDASAHMAHLRLCRLSNCPQVTVLYILSVHSRMTYPVTYRPCFDFPPSHPFANCQGVICIEGVCRPGGRSHVTSLLLRQPYPTRSTERDSALVA